ncbi:hypothetical protein M2263_002373 [Providencia alcalifaciens]|nr:hypothetical protein [Providencia alcalifaciens]
MLWALLFNHVLFSIKLFFRTLLTFPTFIPQLILLIYAIH